VDLRIGGRVKTSNSGVVDSALDGVSSGISWVTSSRESSAVGHAVRSSVVLEVVANTVLVN